MERESRLTAIAMVLLGLAAMALAVVEADHEALSGVFGFAGIATAVFGLLLPRLEGDFELSATGLKGKLLQQARDVASDDGLTLEEKGDALSTLVLDRKSTDVRKGARAATPDRARLASSGMESIPIPPFEWPAPSPAGKLSLRHIPREFEAHLREAFEAGGWQVERTARSDFGDFVAKRPGETVVVEAKAARHLSTADIAGLAARPAEASEPTRKLVLAVPEDGLSSAAARLVHESPMLEMLYVPIVDGTSDS